MFKATAFLLSLIFFFCQLSAQKTIPANSKNINTGDWTVIKKEITGIVQHKNSVYVHTDRYDKGIFRKEMYKLSNNKMELFIGDNILHKERASIQPIFDSKSNLYFFYMQFDRPDSIYKWDGAKLVPFGEEPGKQINFTSIHIDPLDNMIGNVWENINDQEYFVIFKEGKWVSMGVENKREFTKEYSTGNDIRHQSDNAGNLYVNTPQHITKWDGLQWIDIPTKGLGGRISQLILNTTNVLHVVVNGSYGDLNGSNTGTIKKFENGEWIELKWGLEFFKQPNIRNIKYHLAGTDKLYALIDTDEDMSGNKQRLVYGRRNGQWENILDGNPDLSSEAYYQLKTINNDLYLINDLDDLFAKWDPDKPVLRKPAAKNIAPAIVVSQGKRIATILPGSRCIITATKSKDAKYKVGDTIKLAGPAYSFDYMWYSSGMALSAKNEMLSLSDFKARIIYQPAFTDNIKCDPLAETPDDNFGFAKGTKVKILAVGDLDKDQYARASSYVGKEFTVFSSVHPIGDCWYWGMFESEGKMHIINCVQIQRVTK